MTMKSFWHLDPVCQEYIKSFLIEIWISHILRLQKGDCSVEAGFVWSDLLTNLERVADHCSNISGCVLDSVLNTMNIHQNQRLLRTSGDDYIRELQELRKEYKL